MATLDNLYQDLILDHNRSPLNYREMKDANRRAEGNNPLCGDRFTVWLRMDDDIIRTLPSTVRAVPYPRLRLLS